MILLRQVSSFVDSHRQNVLDTPTVVPAECIEYSKPHCFSSLCTWATSLDTDAVGVPMGMRQKSATHAGGVGRLDKSVRPFEARTLVSDTVSPEKPSCCDISSSSMRLQNERNRGEEGMVFSLGTLWCVEITWYNFHPPNFWPHVSPQPTAICIFLSILCDHESMRRLDSMKNYIGK